MNYDHVDTSFKTVRSSLQTASLFELSGLLREHGWQLKINSDTYVDHLKRAIVSAESFRWHQVTPSGYHYGYLTADLKEESILFAARRVAELCLRLLETFKDALPCMHVSEKGLIEQDPVLTEKAQQGNRALLYHLVEESLSRTKPTDCLEHRRGFIQLHWDAQNTLLSQHELITLEGFLREKP